MIRYSFARKRAGVAECAEGGGGFGCNRDSGVCRSVMVRLRSVLLHAPATPLAPYRCGCAETLADHVIALNNAGLRRLVKFSFTEEKSDA